MKRLTKAALVFALLCCILLAFGATGALALSDGAATVTASALNMRSSASTSSSVVTTLPKGTVVLVTGTSGDWYKVWYLGQEGYMSGSYLSLSDSAAAAFGTGTIQGSDVRVRSGASTASSVLGAVNSGKTMDITGVNGSWYKVSYNGSEGYVYSQYMTLSYNGSSSSATSGSSASSGSSSSSSGTGTINAYYVRMRSGPGTGYRILGTYNKGTAMTVTGSDGDWYKVSCDGSEGYVYKTYLTLSSGNGFSVTEKEDTQAVVTSAVNMRTGPSTDYTSLRVLGSGTRVTITGTSGKWSRVDYNGSTGYIFSSYLSTNVSSSASGTTSSGSTKGEAIVTEAKKYQGVPYVYGGTSPNGFDCSGFVYYVYKQCGYSITRTATAQNSDGRYVSRSELQPGDIIIFYNSAKTAIGHAGIYVGNGQFIHASSGSGKVVISSLSSTYYNTHYYSARRVVS